MLTKLLLLLLSTTLLFSCGGKKVSEVNLEVRGSLQFGGSTLAPISTGGLMLWGQSSTGQAFSQALRNSETLNLTLPNGSWRFYAMAWANGNGAELDASTALRCALTPITTLSGGDNTIALELSQSACAAPVFKGNLTNLSQMMIDIQACESVAGLSMTSECTLDRNFPTYISDRAPIMSVRIVLNEYVEGLNLSAGSGLSRCLSFGSGPITAAETTIPGSIVLPVGGSSANPFRISLIYDLATPDCSGAQSETFTTVMPRGLQQTFPNQAIVSSGNTLRLAEAHDDLRLCQGRDLRFPFAGGDGGDHTPYIICSAKQLYEIHNLPIYLNNSFRLAKPINLNATLFTGAPIAGVHPISAGCWEPGQTWQPLGGFTYDPPPSCTMTDNPSALFTGNFDGNNHSLTGLRMRYEESSHIGFISKWERPAPNGYLRDIVFNTPEVSGRDKTGTLVGLQTDAGSFVSISGIRINGGEVEARADEFAHTGGVVGEGSNLNLSDITVRGTTITHIGGGIGGIFGKITGSQKITRLHSYAHILSRYDTMFNEFNVGGIGGELNATSLTSPLSSLTHQGVIITRLGNVGGLFGNLTSNQLIENSYATSSISTISSDQSNSVGGLIGIIGDDQIIQKSYFAGHIIDHCATTCDAGKILGNVSSFTITGSDIFAHASEDNLIVAGGGDFSLSIDPINNMMAGASTLYNTTVGTALTSPAFIRNTGDLPRLASEKHFCAQDPIISGFNPRVTLAQQIANGRGTSTRPLAICNKDQFSELSAINNNVHARIMTGILVSGTYTEPEINSGTILDGKDGYLFGYYKEGDITASEIRSPIESNFGVIRNLLVSNISSLSEVQTDGAGYNSAFVHTNQGIIDGVKIVASKVTNMDTLSQVYSGGIAVNNNSGAVIRNSLFNGSVAVAYSFGAIAHTNNGLIEKSVSDMSFEPVMNGAYIGGIAKENGVNGQIRSVKVEGSVSSDTAYVIDNITFGVVQNQGLIEDIEISSSARWVAKLGTNYSTVALDNLTGGVIRRVVIKGQLLNNDNTVSTTAAPTSGLSVFTDLGLTEGVITMSPSGRLIISEDYFLGTCSGTSFDFNTSLITGTPFEQGGAYFNQTGIGTSKIVWLVLENDGTRNATLVQAQSMAAPIQLDLVDSCTDIGYDTASAGSRYYLVQSNQNTMATAEGDLFTAPYIGNSRANNLDQMTVGTPPWSNAVLNPTMDPNDLEDLLNYYIAETMGSTLPPISPWELEEYDDLSLVKIRN